MTFNILLENGDKLLLEDGTSKLLGSDWGGAYLQASKDAASTTAAPTNITWPDAASKKTYLAGDWALAFVETANEAVGIVPTGWVLVDSTGAGTGGTASATMLSIYAKQAVSAAEAAQDWGDSGDHNLGFIIVFRNLASSTPWELLGKDTVGGIGSAAVTIPGGTTLGANRFVLQVMSTSFDNPNTITQVVGDPPHSSNPFCVTKAVNASLANFRKWWEQHTGQGNGGGILVFGGELAAAGTVDPCTFTMKNGGVQARIALALLPPSGGTTTPLGLSSSVTPAGAIQIVAIKPLSSSITPAGTLAKVVQKTLTGSITAAGVLAKLVKIARTSSVTAAGTLAKKILAPKASTVTPAGTVQKTVQLQAKTSSITPASSHLVQKVALRAFASSIGLTGTLSKVVLVARSSSVTAAGSLAKLVKITRTSSVTAAGSLVATKVILLLLTSTVTAAGILSRRVLKPLASSVGLSGALASIASRARTLTSSIGLSGTLQKQVQHSRSSTVGLSGTLAKRVQWTRGSTVLPAGTLQQQRTKFFAGNSTITPAGTFAKRSLKSFASSIGLSGLFDVVPFRITITRRFYVYAMNRIRALLAHPAQAVSATLEVRAQVPVPRRSIPALLRIRTIQPDEDGMAELPEFSPKRTAEADNFTVDFLNQLNVGETLTGPTVAISVSSESSLPDAGPSLALSGGATISGTKVVQKLTGGLSGVLYVVAFRVGTSTGRTLEQAVRVLVKDETA